MTNDKAAPSRTSLKNKPVLVAEAQDIGYGQQRKRLEDRCVANANLQTAGGLQLAVGMVADGVGGASAGEVAGQTVIDAVMEHIQKSTGKDINNILEDAMQSAHKALRDLALQSSNLRTMSTTGTLAAIHDGKLYLAHVGDSRAYLIRDGKIQLLTLDHSWGNEMIRQDRFKAEEVEKHSKRGDLGRYFGQPVPFEVDLGLRFFDSLPPGTHPAKSSLMSQGFALHPGDVVLLCTDGLIKPRRKAAGHYLEPEEIVKVVQRKRGVPQDTANTLISLALGRQVDDNVSAVIMEVPGGKASLGSFLPVGLPKPGGANNQWLWIIASVVGVLLLLLAAFVLPALINSGGGKEPASTSPAANTAAPVAAAGELGLARLVQGNAEYQLPGQDEATTFSEGTTLDAGPGVTIRPRVAQAVLELSDGARIYVDTGSILSLESVAGAGSQAPVTLIKLQNGRLLIQGAGVVVEADGFPFKARIPGELSIVGVDYDSENGDYQVDCLEGFCRVEGGLGETDLPAGSGVSTQNNRKLDPPGNVAYETWMALGGMLVPTPTPTALPSPTSTITPTPTATIVLPIATPKPTEQDDDSSNEQVATAVPPTVETPSDPTPTPTQEEPPEDALPEESPEPDSGNP